MPISWEDYNAMEEAANALPKLGCVVDFDPDAADGYLGDGLGEDGVYWQVAYLSQDTIDAHDADGWEPGWYLTVVVDSDTGGFVMAMVEDDGPYDTRQEAECAGRTCAMDWCAFNEVDITTED